MRAKRKQIYGSRGKADFGRICKPDRRWHLPKFGSTNNSTNNEFQAKGDISQHVKVDTFVW